MYEILDRITTIGLKDYDQANTKDFPDLVCNIIDTIVNDYLSYMNSNGIKRIIGIIGRFVMLKNDMKIFEIIIKMFKPIAAAISSIDTTEEDKFDHCILYCDKALYFFM